MEGKADASDAIEELIRKRALKPHPLFAVNTEHGHPTAAGREPGTLSRSAKLTVVSQAADKRRTDDVLDSLDA
jgi:hypothetical protein